MLAIAFDWFEYGDLMPFQVLIPLLSLLIPELQIRHLYSTSTAERVVCSYNPAAWYQKFWAEWVLNHQVPDLELNDCLVGSNSQI